MKFKCLLILSLFAISFNTFAQSIEKGNIAFEGGAGIAIYNTRTTHTIQNTTTVEQETGITAAGVFPLFGSYAITDRIAAGAGFRYSTYIHNDSDDVSSATAIDFAIRPEFHLIRSKHTDLYVAGTLGFSHFAYLTNLSNQAQAVGNGTQYGLSLTSRFYFSKSIGMYLTYSYNAYNYPNIKITDNTTNPPDYFQFLLDGSTYGIGLVVNIH